MLENPDLLPKAANITPLKAVRSGFVTRVEARTIGLASNGLGAGRARMEDTIDPAVGLYLRKKVGDRVTRGEVLCEVHWNNAACLHATMSLLERAFEIRPRPARRTPLIRNIMKG